MVSEVVRVFRHERPGGRVKLASAMPSGSGRPRELDAEHRPGGFSVQQPAKPMRVSQSAWGRSTGEAAISLVERRKWLLSRSTTRRNPGTEPEMLCRSLFPKAAPLRIQLCPPVRRRPRNNTPCLHNLCCERRAFVQALSSY
jgi:hypothetical protein